MRVGFTGTRAGMTIEQMMAVNLEFGRLEAYELHHGGCVGADAQMHSIALSYRCSVVIHPSNLPNTQMPLKDLAGPRVEVLPERPPLERNSVIVNAVDHLIAAPAGNHEVRRSGTWVTIRGALKAKVPVTIVYPDGIREEHR